MEDRRLRVFEHCAHMHNWKGVTKADGKCPLVECPYHLAASFGHEDLNRMPRTCLIEALDLAKDSDEAGRTGCVMSMDEIGEIYGISKQRVEQIINRALEKLQYRFGHREDLRDMLADEPEYHTVATVPDPFTRISEMVLTRTYFENIPKRP